MSLTEPSGWDPMEAKHWPMICASIPRPWPREAVLHDLRWWAARERMGDGKRPGRPVLEARWGWTSHKARGAMLSEDEWGDPRASTANRQRTDSEPTANRQVANGITKAIVEEPTADLQRTDSEPTENRPTRVGSQITEHRTQDTEKHAPAPAVADLFATPPNPDSQPSAATGEATEGTDAAPDDGLPAWSSLFKAQPDASKADIVEAIVRCIGAVTEATVKPHRCATSAKPVLTLWKALGYPPIAEFADDFVTVAEAAHRCPVGLFAKDIRAEGWADGTDRQHDVSTIAVQARWDVRILVARQWKASAAGSSAGQQATAKAAAAWDAMTAHPRWRGMCVPGNAPNLPGDYGQPGRWDLADEAAEHDRRMTAFEAAGSIPKWRDADADGRRQFRDRWLELYAKEVTT